MSNLPEFDPTKSNADQGIYQKFFVERTDGSSAPGGKHHGCRYFVLDLDHDPAAPDTLRKYAEKVAESHPLLSRDILTMVEEIQRGD